MAWQGLYRTDLETLYTEIWYCKIALCYCMFDFHLRYTLDSTKEKDAFLEVVYFRRYIIKK